MTEKEILEDIFEFETYCTARFDSEARVAMAVYDYVQQMKRKYKKKLTEGDELSNVKPNPPESKSAPPPPSPRPKPMLYPRYGWSSPEYVKKYFEINKSRWHRQQ
jgi:hypothetical protein